MNSHEFQFISMNFKRKSLAFTLIEMMVTLSIITLLTVMVLAYSRQSERITNLIRDSDKMVYELRRVQNLAMLTLQPTTTIGTTPATSVCGWGIYVDPASSQTSYILFNDLCDSSTHQGDNKYEDGEQYENINLLKGVIVDQDQTKTNVSSVTFVPPEPQVKFNPSSSGDALITMCLETNSSNCFTIHITPAGQIYKE